MSIKYGWMDRLRQRRRRWRFVNRRPRPVFSGLWWRVHRVLQGRDILGVLLLVERKGDVIYHSELSPRQVWAALLLEELGLLAMDDGPAQLHYHWIGPGDGYIRGLIQAEARRLNLDPDEYLADPLRDWLRQTALASR